MWLKNILIVIVAVSAVFFMSNTMAQEDVKVDGSSDTKPDLENTLYIDLPDGRVVVELLPDVAPKHVARIKELSKEHFYDGVVFHRVIEGFMAQTGDPTGTGMGGSDKPDLPSEFSDVSHTRGVVSMARSSDPNSANSQFFIVLEDSTFLDGKYTVFGKVTSGMEFVDQIKKGDRSQNGAVEDPTKMLKVRVASDSDS